MTITVTGPDGSTFNFPDGTTSDVIRGVYQKHYGAPDAQAAPAPAPVQIDPNDPRFTQSAIEAKQAIRGVPILGPLASDRGSAAISALAQPMTGVGSMGATWRERYAANLAQEEQARQAYEAAHPVRSQAIQALGGTLALGGVGGAVPGAARVLGMTGRLAQAVPAAAASGAAIGAADAAARGQDPKTGAVIGGLTGVGGRLAGEGVGRVWDAARGVFRKAPAGPQRFIDVNGTQVPVRESVVTRDPATSGAEQQILGAGSPAAQSIATEAEAGTAQGMQQARQNLSTQLDPTTPPPDVHPLDAPVGDLVTQEQNRAAAEVARIVGARGDVTQLAQDVGGAAPAGTTPQDVGTTIGQRIRDLFTAARARTRAAYNAAAGVPAEYNPARLINAGNDIRQALDRPPPGVERVRISPEVTPQAQNALNTIDQEISQLQFTNDAARGNRPITPADMEQVRKQLVILRRVANNAARMSGNWEDARAVGRVMDGFDEWEQGVAQSPNGLLSGNPADVIAARTAARAAHAQERATFSRRGPGDAVGTFMENTIGKYPGQEMSPQKIVASIMGTPDRPAPENAVPILQHLRDNVFGAYSPEWDTIKRGVVSHLLEAPPGAEPVTLAKQAQRIENFLANDRHAGALFDAGERGRFQHVADSLRAAIPEEAPATGTIAQKIAQLSGRLTGEPMTGEQMMTELFGKKGAQLTRELKQRLPADSLAAIKRAVWERISQAPEGMSAWGDQKTGQSIAKFLNTDLAREMFSTNERAMMKVIADAHQSLVPLPRTTNPSGSAYAAARMAKGARKQLLGWLGAHVGGLHGYMMGHAAGSALDYLGNRSEQQLARQLFLGQQALAPTRVPQAVGAFVGQLPSVRRQDY